MSANVTEGHFADIINKDIDLFSKKMREINYTTLLMTIVLHQQSFLSENSKKRKSN